MDPPLTYQLLDIAVKDAVRLLFLVAEFGAVLLLLLLLGLVVLVVDRVEHSLSNLQHRVKKNWLGTVPYYAEKVKSSGEYYLKRIKYRSH